MSKPLGGYLGNFFLAGIPALILGKQQKKQDIVLDTNQKNYQLALQGLPPIPDPSAASDKFKGKLLDGAIGAWNDIKGKFGFGSNFTAPMVIGLVLAVGVALWAAFGRKKVKKKTVNNYR